MVVAMANERLVRCTWINLGILSPARLVGPDRHDRVCRGEVYVGTRGATRAWIRKDPKVEIQDG
ncbi:hypothetical protein Pen01_52160 [Phytomonospora endophytica]|nr:hypothetical protein Pen01_52160 [Phytomonospora endophytica]